MISGRGMMNDGGLTKYEYRLSQPDHQAPYLGHVDTHTSPEAIAAGAALVVASVVAPEVAPALLSRLIVGAGAGGAVAAANAGCVVRSGTATLRNGNGEYSYSANDQCTPGELHLYSNWAAMCLDQGGHLVSGSNISERGRCELRATCETGSTTEPDEPQEDPPAEGDWCSQHEGDVDNSQVPIISVNGHCSPYMIPARKDAIDTFLWTAARAYLILSLSGYAPQCLASAGMTSDEMSSIFRADNRPIVEVDTETSAEPTITFSYRSDFAIQITVGNVMDQLSCMPVEAARPNNMYTCTADVSSAVYTCIIVQ